jgi:type I restriction enzyme S subunit
MWSEVDEDGIAWVSIGDMSDGQPVVTTARRVSESGVASTRLPVGEPGTLLFAMYASVGAVGRLAIPATWNQALLGIEPRSGLCDERFIRYWLEHLRPSLGGLTRSTTQDNLNAEQVGNFPFPDTPLTEQRAIADYLDAETARIDALIAKKQQLIRLLEERFLARVDDECSGDDVALRRVIARFVDYRGATPEKTDQGVPLLTATHIKGGAVDHSLEPVFVSESTYVSWMRRGFPTRGDVLLTMEAPLGEVAKITEARVALAQRLMLLKTDANRCMPEYLAFALRSTTMQDRLRAFATGSTALGIKADRLKGLPVPLPSLTRQAAIAAALRHEERAKMRVGRLLSHQLNLLVEHRQALIAAAVSGVSIVPGPA